LLQDAPENPFNKVWTTPLEPLEPFDASNRGRRPSSKGSKLSSAGRQGSDKENPVEITRPKVRAATSFHNVSSFSS
jgi:hypothetical protein